MAHVVKTTAMQPAPTRMRGRKAPDFSFQLVGSLKQRLRPCMKDDGKSATKLLLHPKESLQINKTFFKDRGHPTVLVFYTTWFDGCEEICKTAQAQAHRYHDVDFILVNLEGKEKDKAAQIWWENLKNLRDVHMTRDVTEHYFTEDVVLDEASEISSKTNESVLENWGSKLTEEYLYHVIIEDQDEFPKEYEVTYIPHVTLVDADGLIFSSRFGTSLLQTASINELIERSEATRQQSKEAVASPLAGVKSQRKKGAATKTEPSKSPGISPQNLTRTKPKY